MWNATVHEIDFQLQQAALERRLRRQRPLPPPRPSGGLRRFLAARLVRWGVRLDPNAAAQALGRRNGTPSNGIAAATPR